MRYHWIQDRASQNQFDIFWKAGVEILADYFTKHHPAIHHKRMRYVYLNQNHLANTAIRGCIDHGTNMINGRYFGQNICSHLCHNTGKNNMHGNSTMHSKITHATFIPVLSSIYDCVSQQRRLERSNKHKNI